MCKQKIIADALKEAKKFDSGMSVSSFEHDEMRNKIRVNFSSLKNGHKVTTYRNLEIECYSEQEAKSFGDKYPEFLI